MKRKTKILFSALILTITLLLSIISIRAFVPSSSGNENNADVAATTPGPNQVLVDFRVYDKEKYTLLQDILRLIEYMYDDSDGTYYHSEGYKAWTCAYTGKFDKDKNMYSSADPSKSCKDYYMSKYGFEYPFIETTDTITATYVSGAEVKEKTEFAANDDILIEIFATFSSVKVTSYSIRVNAIDNMTNIQVEKGTSQLSHTAGPAAGGRYHFGGSSGTEVNYYDFSGGIVAGVITGTIAGTGNIKVEYYNGPNGESQVTNENGPNSSSDSNVVVIGEPLEIILAGPSESTDIDVSLTTSTATYPLTSAGTDPEFSKDLDGTEANKSVTLNVTGKDKSTLVRYLVADDLATAKALASATSLSANTTTTAINVPLGNRGTSKFIAVEVKPEADNGNVIRVIEINVKKFNEEKLNDIELSIPVAGDSLLAPAFTTAFNSSTGTYTVNVADDLDKLGVKPEFDKGQTVLVKYGSNTITATGSNVAEIPLSGVNEFTVEVKSEDGSKNKTYTITVNRLNTKAELNDASGNPVAFNVKSGTITRTPTSGTNVGPWTYQKFPYKDGTNVLSNFNVLIASDATNVLSKLEKIEILDGSNTYNVTSSGSGNIPFATSGAKTLNVKITPKAGAAYAQTYTLTVEREAGSNDADLTKFEPYYYTSSGGQLLNYNTVNVSASVTKYVVTDKVPFTVDGANPKVYFIADYASTATAKEGSVSPCSVLYASGNNSKQYQFAGVTTTLTVYLEVTSELGSTKQYIIEYERVAPANDKSVKNITVTDNKGNTYNPTLTTADNTFTTPAMDYDAASGIKVYLEYDSTATAQISTNGGSTWNTYNASSISLVTASGSPLQNVEIQIKVTAQDTTYQIYKFIGLLRTPDNNEKVTMTANLLSGTYSFVQDTGSAKSFNNSSDAFPFGTSGTLTLNLDVDSPTTRVEYSGKTITSTSSDKTITINTWNTSSPVKIKIYTEANPTGTEYKINFSIAPANDDHGSGYQTVVVQIDGVDVPLDLNGTTYESRTTYPYPSTETVQFKVDTSVSTNKILNGAGTVITGNWENFLPYSGANPTITFKVQTQLNTHTYTIKIKTDAPSSDKSLAVQLSGENTSTTWVTPAFGSNIFTHAFRQTIVGSNYYAKLTCDPTAKLYVSTTNPTNPTGTYSDSTKYVIGTDLYVKVVAQDGTQQIYTIKTSFVDESDDGLKSFTIDGIDVMSYVNSGTATYNLPYTTTTFTAQAEANSSLSTITDAIPSATHIGSITKNGVNPGDVFNIAFNVTAPGVGGAGKPYIVKVVVDANPNIEDLQVLDPDNNNLIDYATNVLNATVPYSTDKVTLFYELTAELDGYGAASALIITVNGNPYVEGDDINLNVGNNTIIFNVKTNSGVNNTKTIKIKREAGSSDATISVFTQEDGVEHTNFQANTNFSYRLDKTFTTFDPQVIPTDPKASWTIVESDKHIAIGNKNQFSILVTAEDGTTKTYKFNVYSADNNKDLLDIKVVDSNTAGADVVDALDGHTFTLDTAVLSQAKLTVGNPVTKVYIKVTFASQYAYVSVKGNKQPMTGTDAVGNPVYYYEALLTEGTINTFEVFVESEYGHLIASQPGYNNEISTKYTLNIERKKADSDATLKSLVFKNADGNVLNFTSAFQSNTYEYTITDVGDITSVNIEAIPNLGTTKVNIQGVDVFSPNYSTNISLPAFGSGTSGSSTNNYIFDRYIYTTAEDGTTKTYHVVISRGEVDLADDTDVEYYKIYDEFGNVYFGQADFNPATTEYSVTVPFGPNSITIEGFKTTTYSPVTFEGTGLFTIQTEWLDSTKAFLVNSKSSKGTKGTVYTFNITFEAPVYVDTLDDIKIDGVSLPDFDPEVLEYDYGKVPHAKTTVDVSAILSDPNATIVNKDELTGFQLNVGKNTVTITVKSQAGDFKTYKVFIEREPAAAELLDLYIADTVLRDLNQNVTTFTPAVKDYMAIVPWDVASTSITVKVPNPAYITSCNSVTLNAEEYRTFDNLPLVTGNNVFTINAISTEGNSVNYTVTIIRRPQPSSDTSVDKINMDCFDVNSKLIPVEGETLETDYTNTQTVYNYKVPNKVTNVKINLIPSVIGDVTTGSLGSTYEVYNNTNFKVGMNTVVVVVTAEDGVTTKHIIINIEREKMAYTVNSEAYENYKLSANEDGTYTLDLGSDVASVVEDYTKYIVTNPDDNLTVEVLSDVQNKKCSEVVLKITDGDQTEYVKVLVQTTATDPGIKFDPIWILFGLAILMLIVILICVNRDKYGSINKSRKRIKE